MDNRAKALAALAAERWRVSFLLTVSIMFIYFCFILLIAFYKPLMFTLLLPVLIFVIFLVSFVIVSSCVLIYIYVRFANTHYD